MLFSTLPLYAHKNMEWKVPRANQIMATGLRHAPEAVPDLFPVNSYFVPRYHMTPEDGMSIPRLLAILLRVTV